MAILNPVAAARKAVRERSLKPLRSRIIERGAAMAKARKVSRRAATKGRSSARRAGGARKSRWSQRVTQESDALTLERRVFAKRSPREIAQSLKRSAERSRRRKSGAFRSAMSMLTFYINRAGRTLPAARKKTLNHAKDELRALYGRD
jgi:hypothetical protein